MKPAGIHGSRNSVSNYPTGGKTESERNQRPRSHIRIVLPWLPARGLPHPPCTSFLGEWQLMAHFRKRSQLAVFMSRVSCEGLEGQNTGHAMCMSLWVWGRRGFLPHTWAPGCVICECCACLWYGLPWIVQEHVWATPSESASASCLHAHTCLLP